MNRASTVAAALTLFATLSIGLIGCGDPRTANGTALYVRVSFDPGLGITQLRAEVSAEQRTSLEAVQVPEQPEGPLQGEQTLRVLLPDALADAPVTVEVQGLAAGQVVAAGQGRATVVQGYEVEVSIRLTALVTDPDAGVDAGEHGGEDAGDGGGEDGGVDGGEDAGVCSTCDPSLSDECSPTEGCRCGDGPSCDEGQRCTGGACTCDGSSCPNGCCAETACQTPSVSTCGAGGSNCIACIEGAADTCSSEGTCRCGEGPACEPGQRCVSGACSCDSTSCASGCCDGTVCLPGDLDTSCGAGGRACDACPSGETCTGGVCSGCNDTTCPNGCCSGFTCNTPDVDTCGVHGGACVACDSDTADNCSPDGVCRCGAGPTCASGQRCVAGACVCNSNSCTGCCAGNSCQTGDDYEACGSGGVTCGSCNVVGSNNCGPNGCRCGSGPPCNSGACLLGLCI